MEFTPQDLFSLLNIIKQHKTSLCSFIRLCILPNSVHLELVFSVGSAEQASP